MLRLWGVPYINHFFLILITLFQFSTPVLLTDSSGTVLGRPILGSLES